MWAQTEDVTSTYLDNAGFDDCESYVTTGVCTYAKDVAGNSGDGSSLMAVTSWTAGANGDAKAGGAYSFGNNAWLTGTSYKVPATNSDGESSGGALGLGGCWNGDAYYTQALKQNLPAGTYTVEIMGYNVGTATAFGTQTFGIKESGGKTHYVTTTWTAGAWTKATVSFELSAETAATFYLGATGVAGGSAASAKLFIDYVKIYKAKSLQELMDEATEENPADVTKFYLQNAAVTGTDGWTNGRINSGQQYTDAPDNTYLDAWNATYNMNQKVTLKPGKYTLKAATRAISTISVANIYANVKDGTNNSTAITAVGNTDGELGNGWGWTTVDFLVTKEAEVTIGFYSECGSSKWAGADNFSLYYVRGIQASDFTYTLATGKMSAAASQTQREAESVFTANPTLDTYNTLSDAIKAANASVTAYTNIKAYYDMTSAKVSGDYSSYTTDYEAGNYETEAQGIAAIKAIRNGIATNDMAAGADLTSLIDNPGFELGNTNYWKTISSSDTGARDANNETFKMSGSEGDYLFNTWWQGTPITQNLGKLPAGVYELGATIASDGGTIYMTMNGSSIGYIETMDKTVGITGNCMFTLSEETEVTIGLVGGGQGTAGQHKEFSENGYWFYKADNFTLAYLGTTAPENTIDGVYTLTVDGYTFLSRGGDSGTEAVTSQDNPIAVKITTVSAGIQTIQFMDTKGYLMWNGEMVYTDGTMEPKKETHLSYWKVEKAAGVNNYTILNTQSGGYLNMTTATRDGNEINVATLDGSPESWGLAKLDEEQLTAVQDMIDLANATTIPTDEAEIGDGVFQYTADNIDAANIWVSNLKGASATVLAKIYNTEDFVGDKAIMTVAVNNMLTLNAPSETQAYKIILKYDGWTYNNCAITSMNNRDGQGGYNLQYKAQNPNYAQALFFTPATVEGKLNTYKISFTDAEGTTRYISTGTPYGGYTGQIRTTTNADDALVVEVVRNGANIKLYNTAANQFIGSQDAGVYTVGSHNDFAVEETTAQNAISKTVAEGKYATVVLPYAATLTTGKAYTATVDGSSVNLEEVTSLEANKAYILGEGTYNFTGVNIAFAEPAANGVLTGVYTATAVPVGSYVLQTKDGVQKFYKVAENAQPTLSANKAYLTVPETSAGAKSLNISNASETAIKTLDSLINGNAKIYDLNGRELKSLQKGVNIVNGVKVFVK